MAEKIIFEINLLRDKIRNGRNANNEEYILKYILHNRHNNLFLRVQLPV